MKKYKKPISNLMETPLEKECFVKVAKGDLEKLTTEVMQLREFLPRVVKDLLDLLRKEKENELIVHDQERLTKECLHLGSRLDWAETERQREREEKLALKEELWACRQQMQQQAQFCVDLGAASCTVLWSTSGREQAVGDMLAHGELQPFLDMAAQTLDSFVRSHHSKAEPQEQNSSEHQFVLALAGVITNIAAVSCGRDHLSNCGHALLDTLLQLLKLMETGTLPRLKVLMLKALYNVSISVRGLKYISQSPLLLPMICTLLEDGDADVCLHSLRVLQSLLLEEEVAVAMGAALMDSLCVEHVGRLTSNPQHTLRRAARDTVVDLEALFRKFGKSVDQSGLVQ